MALASDPNPYSSCFGKLTYPSKARAIERIKRRKQSRGRKGSNCTIGMALQAYKCQHCHQWHVGSTSQHTVYH